MARANAKPVVMFLTYPEASFLLRIMELISGHPEETARCYADAISSALYKAGIRPMLGENIDGEIKCEP